MAKKDLIEDDLFNDLDLDDDLKNDLDSNLNDGFDDFNFNDYTGDSQTPMDKYGDLLKELTNFDPFVKDMVADWLGVEWDSKRETWKEAPDVEPRINKQGAKAIVSLLKTYARKNNIITNISETEFRWIHEDLINETYTIIPVNAENYGIKSNPDLMLLCHQVYTAAILVMFGAGDGKYNKLLSETTMRHENLNYAGEQYNNRNMVMQKKPKKRLGTKIMEMFRGE